MPAAMRAHLENGIAFRPITISALVYWLYL